MGVILSLVCSSTLPPLLPISWLMGSQLEVPWMLAIAPGLMVPWASGRSRGQCFKAAMVPSRRRPVSARLKAARHRNGGGQAAGRRLRKLGCWWICMTATSQLCQFYHTPQGASSCQGVFLGIQRAQHAAA